MELSYYVIIVHPYFEASYLFGPYETQQDATEDSDGWRRAVFAANQQLLEAHEEKIRVIITRLAVAARVPAGYAGGDDWIYSTQLQRVLPAGRERFLSVHGTRLKEWEAKRQEQERLRETRRVQREQESRRKDEESRQRREEYLARAAALGLDERVVFLLDRVSELEAELADCRAMTPQ